MGIDYKRVDVHVCIIDLLCYTTETSNIVNQLYSNKNLKNKSITVTFMQL